MTEPEKDKPEPWAPLTKPAAWTAWQWRDSLATELDRHNRLYPRLMKDADTAAATHLETHAKRVVVEMEKMRQAGDRPVKSIAETIADADDDIALLHLNKLTSASLVRACKSRIDALHESLRSAVSAIVDDRNMDNLHASGNAAGGGR